MGEIEMGNPILAFRWRKGERWAKGCIGCLLVLSFSLSASEPREYVVNSPTFEVAIEPTQPEDMDTKRVFLYITRFLEAGWTLEGICTVSQNHEGPVFLRRVSVPGSGIYYFTSQGAVASGSESPPGPETPPQVKVIVDTERPQISFRTPRNGTRLQAGEEIRIEWDAEDENFPLRPIFLYYSLDRGKTWLPIAEELANNGIQGWQVPETGGKELFLKVRAIDRAGNASEAMVGPLSVQVSPASGVIPTLETKNAIAEVQKESPHPSSQGGVESEPPIPHPSPSSTPSKEKTQITAIRVLPSENAGASALAKKAELPPTRFPDLDGNLAPAPSEKTGSMKARRAAYIAYVMGGNLVRQGRLKDALRYYRTAVDADENFAQAWNDMGLIFKELGAYTKADTCMVHALRIDPRNPIYIHNRGEVYQAYGLSILESQPDEEKLAKAREAIHFAIKMYGRAIEEAERTGRLADRAATFFRLGEICYFANQDPVGAREYWLKVLSLHTPTPDLDNVMHDQGTPEEARSLELYRTHTERKVLLETWQRWAQAYLHQLNELERSVAPQAALRPGELDTRLKRVKTLPLIESAITPPPPDAPARTPQKTPPLPLEDEISSSMPSPSPYFSKETPIFPSAREESLPPPPTVEYLRPRYGNRPQMVRESAAPSPPLHERRPSVKRESSFWKRFREGTKKSQPSSDASPFARDGFVSYP